MSHLVAIFLLSVSREEEGVFYELKKAQAVDRIHPSPTGLSVKPDSWLGGVRAIVSPRD